jgi:two-component system, OmpR family, sensor histidine kinase VicK
VLSEGVGTVIIQLKDNGIGIPLIMQDKLFEKFTSVGREGTEQETSKGLGLFIVKEIAQLHQGNVWVESAENQGTSFFIELPAYTIQNLPA